MPSTLGITWVLLLVSLTIAQDVLVTTKYGKLRGTSVSFDRNGDPAIKVNTFLGVPYASPPVGKRRLKSPVDPCVWKPSILNATHYRNVCIQDKSQYSYYKNVWPSFDPNTNIAEDCLYLNIYAPDFKALHPVMVYIHDGGFTNGASILWPGYELALQGVVVVILQYRLGPLGFLSTGDQQVPGNFGLLDQVQALKWVKENIDGFGGNPQEVTLFGAGAGATSISLHLVSPLSEKLFHRAILESGSDISPWPLQTTESTLKRSKAIAKSLGCYQTDSVDLLKCLQQVSDATNFVKANDLFSSWGLGAFSFGPIVGDSFLPDRPDVLRKQGMFHKVPIIVGLTANESSLFLAHTLKTIVRVSNISTGINEEVFHQYCHEYSQALQPRSTRLKNALFDALLFEYYPWHAPKDSHTRLEGLIDMASDHIYGAPAIATLGAHRKHAPTYMFVFNHRSKLSPEPAWAGVPHGSSSRYVLGLVLQNSTDYDVIDHNVSTTMMTMWTNMAKYGNPTPKNVAGVTWHQFTVSNQDYMSFDGEPVAQMAQNFYGSRAAFWNYYYPKIMRENSACPTPRVKSGCEKSFCTRNILLLVLGLYLIFYELS